MTPTVSGTQAENVLGTLALSAIPLWSRFAPHYIHERRRNAKPPYRAVCATAGSAWRQIETHTLHHMHEGLLRSGGNPTGCSSGNAQATENAAGLGTSAAQQGSCPFVDPAKDRG